MLQDLIDKIDQTELMINNSSLNKPDDVNSMFIVIDSMMEFYEIPPDLALRYNRLKQDYAKTFKDERVYYSIDRNIRINNIAKDIDQFVDLTNYIAANIEQQREYIDNISTNMATVETNVVSTVSELEIHRAKVNLTMKIWRYIVIILGIVLIIGIYQAVR